MYSILQSPFGLALFAIILEGIVMVPAAAFTRDEHDKSRTIIAIYAGLALFTLFVCIVIMPMMDSLFSSSGN